MFHGLGSVQCWQNNWNNLILHRKCATMPFEYKEPLTACLEQQLAGNKCRGFPCTFRCVVVDWCTVLDSHHCSRTALPHPFKTQRSQQLAHHSFEHSPTSLIQLESCPQWCRKKILNATVKGASARFPLAKHSTTDTEVISKIGYGRYSTVWLAKDLK